jgi:AP endonuclease-1
MSRRADAPFLATRVSSCFTQPENSPPQLFSSKRSTTMSDAEQSSSKRTISTRTRKTVVYKEESDGEELDVTTSKTVTKKSATTRKRKPIDSDAEPEDEVSDADEDVEDKNPITIKKTVAVATTKKQKTTLTTTAAAKPKTKPAAKPKAPKVPTASTMSGTFARVASKMLIGAHVSMAKGVQNSITNASTIGANSFALFLKNQRKWSSPAMPASDAAAFRKLCEEKNYNPKTHILPHGSYLINLATPTAEKQKQAYDCFVDDLKRCEELGIGLYNFHPGSTLGEPRSEALKRISDALNKAHRETKFVKTVVENMVGAGNVVGSSFEDLRDILEGVEDKSRVGICLDTCHMFAAGHDIRTKEKYEEVMGNFDRIVGRKYLCAIHLNDSKGPFESKKDLHQSIGQGYIGLEAFRVLMNDSRLEGLPIVLETPTNDDPTVWAREIKLLESLVGMKGDEGEFLKMAEELQAKGEGERERVGAVVAKGKAKAAKTSKATAKKGGRKKKIESDDEDSEGSGCSH